ncbi:hypothetical protein ACOMHN_015215 [Nucella lapillus]
MSTTLSVLHVLMAGPGRDVNLPAHDIIHGGGGPPGLDPRLQDFWSAFPCPPPWNHALLFRVNWTACVGQAVGERLKWFLADRCHIPHDGTRLLPVPGQEGEEEEMEAPEVCSLPCIIIIALACLLFCLLIAAVVFCVCRKRPKNSSPTHQSALTAHPDTAKYYTSCHYASAPVMARPLETTLCGSRTETRLLNGSCAHQMSPYHHQHGDHPPLLTPQLVTSQHVTHCAHTHLTPLLVNVSGQTSVARHGTDLPLSAPTRGLLTYRRLEGGGGGEYTSSSGASHSNSDRSHTYESIGDGTQLTDAFKNGVGGVGGHLSLIPHTDLQRAAPDFCDCDCSAHLDLDTGSLALDGYYNDRGTQTLPVRHLRHVVRDTDPSPQTFGGPYSFDIEDSSHGPRPDSRLSNRSRRRTSSGSHYSDRSFGGGYREGQKRTIPALHPNYFDPPEPPAPDTFIS